MHLDVELLCDLEFLDVERYCTPCTYGHGAQTICGVEFDTVRSGSGLSRTNIIESVTELLHDLLSAVREMDPVLRTLVAGVGMLLETSIFIGLVVPGDSIALIASIGVETGAEFFWLVIALLVGAVIGESIGYTLGRWVGPRLRDSRLGRRLGGRNWQVAEHYLSRRGGLAVFLSRFLPVLHALVPLTAGMAGMPYRRFIGWTSSASLVWSILLVSFGAGAAGTFEQLADRTQIAGFILVGLVVVVAATLWAVKRWFFRTELASLEDDLKQRPET